MDQAFLNAVINDLGLGIAALVERLSGVGAGVGSYLLTAEIMLLFLGMMQGFPVMGIVRVLAVTGCTVWTLDSLAGIMRGGIDVGRAIIGGLIEGYDGPGALITFAIEVTARIARSALSLSFSGLSEALNSIGSLMMMGPILFVVFLCLCSAGLLALFAEMEFMLAGALAPLVLPLFLFSATRSMASGTPRLLLAGLLRIVAAGAYGFLFNSTIVEHFPQDWATQGQPPPTFSELLVLLVVSFALAVFGGYVYRLPDKMLGYMGSLAPALTDRVMNAVTEGIKAASGGAQGAAVSALSSWASGTQQAANGNSPGGASWQAAVARQFGTGGGHVGTSSGQFGGGARSPFVRKGP